MKKKFPFFVAVNFLLLIISMCCISCTDKTVECVEYVDLGLPSGTLWATTNVGALSPEDFGDYFAWGDTEGAKSGAFPSSSYKWCKKGDMHKLTKYCNDKSYGYNGFTDMVTTLKPSDDAASANWGNSWRMPTEREFDELLSGRYCRYKWYPSHNIKFHGVAGYKVTSKMPGYKGNYIFLPAAGHPDYRGPSQPRGHYGHYWTSSLGTTPQCAIEEVLPPHELHFSNNLHRRSELRYNGSSIRPVLVIDKKDDSMQVVSASEEIGSGKPNNRITTESPSHTFVDLGLPSGTKWATVNVGANSPEEYGDYFAWGETEGYRSGKSDFSWTTYKWCDGDLSSLTKYCGDTCHGNNGFRDTLVTLEKADDVAAMKWGGNWRIPTKAQWLELFEYCNVYEVNSNAQSGDMPVLGLKLESKVSGYEGNYIYLPAAGRLMQYDRTPSQCNNEGFYWSSSVNASWSHVAWMVNFDLAHRFIRYYLESGTFRSEGLSVRPVINLDSSEP
ncbi:MAG: hypothetical protein Q4E99_03300 [Bacillota bacterium]|nr:hypothetical protein [Bacillota bacterium]